MQNNNIDEDEITVRTPLLNDSIVIQIDPPSLQTSPNTSDSEQENEHIEIDILGLQTTLQEHSHILLPPPPPSPPVLTLPRIRMPPRRIAPSTVSLPPPPELHHGSFTRAIQNVIIQRRNAIVDPDEEYVNFNDLEDVKVTLNMNAFNTLEVVDPANDELCCICWDEMFFNAIVLPCNHYFHVECAKKWLLTYSYKCPLCKQPAGDREAHL